VLGNPDFDFAVWMERATMHTGTISPVVVVADGIVVPQVRPRRL